MEIGVEIRENIGVQMDPEIGEVKSVNDQYSIIVSSEQIRKAGRSGIEVGLVSLTPGRPINLLPPINRFPKDVQQAIVDKTREQLKELTQAAVEAAESEEEKARLQEAANQESDRRAFFPPSDSLMSAAPPSSIVDASGKPVNMDDVDVL